MPYSTTVDLATAAASPDFLDGRQACAGQDPEIFYPAFASDNEKALRICRRCELAEPCLVWALRTRQAFGIWGATTPRQRNKLQKGRTR